jgi:hypothetical protein
MISVLELGWKHHRRSPAPTPSPLRGLDTGELQFCLSS